MKSDERELIKSLGDITMITFRDHVINVFLFAVFVPLGILSLHNSVRTQIHRKTACIVICGALFATGLMISNFAMLIILIRSGMVDNIGTPIAKKRILVNKQFVPWQFASFIVQLFPLLANDALIIWRAWVIFSKRHWALYILAILWLITAGVILGSLCTKFKVESLEYASYGLTLGTNIVATSFIGYTLWEFRKVLKIIRRKSKVWKIMVLLFEIGFIYCLVQVITVISIIVQDKAAEIQVPLVQDMMGTLSTICAMFSALYPILVATVIQGPSVMLGMHKTATSIHESQVNVNVV